MNAVEMRSLRRICGASLADRIRDEEIHNMAGTSKDVTVRMKNNVLRWFRHECVLKEWQKRFMMEKSVVREIGGDLS